MSHQYRDGSQICICEITQNGVERRIKNRAWWELHRKVKSVGEKDPLKDMLKKQEERRGEAGKYEVTEAKGRTRFRM